MNRIFLMTLTLLIALLPAPLWAGSAQADEHSFEPEQIADFAKAVERYAANAGARAFIIGRVGRPENELPEGIAFTHTAIAIYSTITLADGEQVKGYAIHNLYQKAEAVDQSELITDYPADFFWSAKSLKAGIVIPHPRLQAQLIELIASGKNADLHIPVYSAIANPFDSRYQNCTEYTLDVINAAIYQTTDQAKLKANARAHFKPQLIHESPLKIALGSMFMKDIASSDHNGKAATATFTTIARYLAENELVAEAVTLDHNGLVTKLL